MDSGWRWYRDNQTAQRICHVYSEPDKGMTFMIYTSRQCSEKRMNRNGEAGFSERENGDDPAGRTLNRSVPLKLPGLRSIT